MRGLIEAAARAGAARAALLGEALQRAAADELPAMDARPIDGGIRIAGRGLARRLAFEAPVARLIASLSIVGRGR